MGVLRLASGHRTAGPPAAGESHALNAVAVLLTKAFPVRVSLEDTNLHRELQIAEQLTDPGGREVSGFRGCKGVWGRGLASTTSQQRC